MKGILFTVLILASGFVRAEIDQQWAFDVYLDDKQIGSHTFALERRNDKTILTSEADFKVKFLFVTAFEYEHRNKEVWVDGCLAAIEATTNNNGERLVVEGQRDATQFAVTGKNGAQELEGCVQTFAYWQPDILNASNLLNAQTGEYEAVDAAFETEETIEINGQNVLVDRYRLAAKKGDMKLWYTRENQRWVGLDAPAKGDRRIRYQASDLPPVQASVVARSNQ